MLATPVRLPMAASCPIVENRNGCFAVASKGRQDIVGRHLRFAQRMLPSRRVAVSRQRIRNHRTIAEGPDAGPVGHFQALVHEHAAAFRAGQCGEQRIGRGPGRPDQRVGRDRVPSLSGLRDPTVR